MFANLYEVETLSRPAAWLIATVVSVICGAVIGLEREGREKPAGLRTVTLICVGSTIFTIVSIAMATKPMSDPARTAAQIVTGIGFLGAGAIIRARGTVLGLTTGATIWAVAAVGMTLGAGHVFIGVCFTFVILCTLTLVDRLDWIATGRCKECRVVIAYAPERGKTRLAIQDILDNFRVTKRKVRALPANGESLRMEIDVCFVHRDHRAIIRQLSELPHVEDVAIDSEPSLLGFAATEETRHSK